MDTEYEKKSTDCLDKSSYLDKAIGSLASKYLPGFWTWMKDEREVHYEIIKYNQEIMEHDCQSGTTEAFKHSTKRWWDRVAANLREYRALTGRHKQYKDCL